MSIEAISIKAISGGPRAFSRAQRLQTVQDITATLRTCYGASLLALSLYGSLARGTDGPFSDIELFCVVEGLAAADRFEWSAGPWKAEVDVYSPAQLFGKAAEFDEFWPISQGAFVYTHPLYDPQALFRECAQKVFEHSPEETAALEAELLIGDLYECIGKIRNMQSRRQFSGLVPCVVDLLRFTACLIGIDQKHLYTTSSTLFLESLQLPGVPEGYPALCQRMIKGEFLSSGEVVAEANTLWEGLEAWANTRQIPLTTSLNQLLKKYEKCRPF